jgi:transcription termination/antitermination protein NusG
MKDPAVIDEPISTSPTDGSDETPVADSLEDAADLREEADADAEEVLVEAAAEAVVIAEAADELAEETVEEAAAEADGLEAQGDHQAAETVAEEGFVDAAMIETAGEEAAEQVMADAVVEAAAAEAVSDEIGQEAVAEAEASEQEALEAERLEAERLRAETVEAERLEAAAAQGEAHEPAPVSDDPFGGPGDWYVVHTYAGYENKVKTNLESRIHTMQMEDKIFRVHIPMEDVMEIKSGKKQVVQKKVFPGYLLVKMWYDNDSWYVVRNTPGVTGFVSAGTGSKPTPLSKREIEKILVVKKEEVKPQFRLGFEEGDVVRIISGPFADFNGTINEINMDQSKLKVLVNIFDRETPVELGFDQVSKV